MLAKKPTLIFGDILVIAIITFIGFATHGEADVSFMPRMGAIFFPLLAGWFLLAHPLGLFNEQVTANPKSLWRVPLAIFFVAPFASILRSALLHGAALPIFTLVLGGTNGLGMLAWRALFTFFIQQNKK